MDSSHSPSFAHFRLPLSHSQSHPDVPLPRCALHGSLDPTTGIFYRTPEHTRIRTSQACDKCRVRKAKCSGDHPVCERCRIRGLACHYAPERRIRRWSKTKVERDHAVPDGGTNDDRRPIPPSADVQPARPRCKLDTSSTSHAPPSRTTDDTDRPRSGSDGGRRTRDTAPRAHPRRTTIASAEVHSSSSDGGVVQSERPFSQHVLDTRCGPDRSRKGHPLSHNTEALETTEESLVCQGEDGKGMLEDDLGTPRIEENALALCFDPYTGDPPAFLGSIFTPKSLEATGDDVSRVALADHDSAYINPCLTGAEYPEGVDGAQYPMLFYHPLRSHRSGSCFDISLVDLGTLSNNERPSLCCASDAESPGQTPSTSSSGSPVLTRASSNGLPTTPTNSYPNSPFALASLSPHLGPFAGGPHAYSLFTSEVQTMDGHHGIGMSTEYVAWREAKDGARASEFGGNVF